MLSKGKKGGFFFWWLLWPVIAFIGLIILAEVL
jgi:hypothetical protein